MALSFEESKKALMQQAAKPMMMSAAPMTLSLEDNLEPIAAYSGETWTRDDAYRWFDDYVDEKISYVDENKNIKIDPSQVNISQESNSQFIPFEMMQKYDGIDLSNMGITIHYIRSDGSHGSSVPVNVEYSGEKIKFAWLVDEQATCIVGNMKFEIHADGDIFDAKGNKYAYRWKSNSTDKFNIIKSLCNDVDDCDAKIEINDNWVQDIIDIVTNKVSDAELSGYATQAYVHEQIDAIPTPDVSGQINTHNTSSNAHRDIRQLIENINVPDKLSSFTNDVGYLTTIPEEYVTDEELTKKGYLTEHQNLDAYAKKEDLEGLATETYVLNQLGNIVDDQNTPITVKDYIESKVKGIDVSDKLGDLTDAEGNPRTVEQYVQDQMSSIDVSDQLGNLGIDDEGNPRTVVDYVDYKVSEIDLSEYVKTDDVYTKDEIDELVQNVDLTGYATEDYVNNKTSGFSDKIDANTSDIATVNSAIAKINQELESVDKTPNAYYITTYNQPYSLDGVDYTGENTLVLWKTDETDSDGSRTYVSSHEIVGGSGGVVSSNTIVIDRVTASPIVVSSNDNIVIDYIFTGTDSSGEDIQVGYATWKIGNKTIINKELIKTSVNMENGFNTQDLTPYLEIGNDQKVTLLITDEAGSPPQSKIWYVSVVDIKLESDFKDKNYYTANSSVDFTFVPRGAVDKTVHFFLDGESIGTKTSPKSASGLRDSYTIPAQEHGSYLLEAYMTAEIGTKTVTSNKIIKDIIWYDSNGQEPVIGINYQNFDNFSVEQNAFTAKQYDATKIEYTVFDPSTSFPTVTIQVDGKTVLTPTLTSPTDSYTFSTDVVGTHIITIACGDTVKTINANIEELNIDVSPITTGLTFDFNPSGYSNNSANRLWTNGTVSMSVSPNFDWTNGGYRTEAVKTESNKEYEESYFLIKAGTWAEFDYLMFDGGIDKNPSILGSEMKLIFMTEKVQKQDAVWFSNVESVVSEVDGVQKTTNVGIQLSAHEGWLKTNNASDTDVAGDDESGAIAATNTYLYLPYSEEDVIEMDINIGTLEGDNAFVMAYEDGVPSKAYVYDSSDRFYQYNPKPIRIGSDYCDVRIYRMKVYSNSLGTEDIMKNFIADARNTEMMLNRYNKNSIYYNSGTGTYTPYQREGILDPERLALAVPNVKILMLETDHFTTSKKTFIKSNFRCIHAPGGDLFNGDPFYDNWLFENGWHSGQGTTSDNYGNSSRNVDFLFNCDGVHKPSDKVSAEADYISQVTLGYGTEDAITEKVTDWKGDKGKVALTRTSVPNNFFNLKVNVASSENVNNMLLQKRYNDFLPYISPAKKRDANIKCTMEFVPAILFIRETNPDISMHTEFLDTEWHFYSLGNIGDSKKTDYTRAYDPEDMNEFTLEISDNTKNNSTFQSGVYLDNDGNRQIEKFTIVESEEDGEIILTPVSTDKPQSFVYPITVEEWEHEDNMRRWCIDNEGFDGDHSFEARYACCGDYRDGKLVNDTSGRGKAQMKLNEDVWRAFYRWVITSTDKEFVDELDEWCVRSAVEFFYAFTHIYTMMDNRAKNTFWHFAKTGTYRKVSKPVPELLHVYCELVDDDYVTTSDTVIDESKTYYTQYAFDMHDYDNDTALGINNNGELVFPYGKEDIDYNIDGNPASGYVFNGATSVFWCRLRDLLANEIKTTFQTATSDCFSAQHLIKQFDDYQECYPEEIWRLDIERKYIRTFTGDSVDNSKPKRDVQYLRDMMQGRKKYQRRQWVRDQELYFGTMNVMDTVVGDNNRITFRCFTPTGNKIAVKPDYTLRITPYADMYVSVMFGNGGVQQKRAKAGEEYVIECPLSTMDDTQVTIYGANIIQALNDLSACYIAANNFSNATRLKKLVIGNTTEGYSNPKLVSLSIGNNELLEELDIRNCASLTGSLNLANCNNLLKLYAEGTSLTGVTFATNGKIQVAHLPNTINTLIMRNLNDLVDFEATLSQLETLTLQGGTLDSLDIVTRCINTLMVVYLYDIDWNTNTELLDRINALFYSLLTGKVHVPIIRQKQLELYQEKWNDLEITYDDGGLIIQHPVVFKNYDGTVLYTQYVDHTKDAVDPVEAGLINPPTKPSDISTQFTFIGWDRPLTSVYDPREVYAVYEGATREYTIKYVSRGVVLQTSSGMYGDYIEYTGETPVDVSKEPNGIYYLFKDWDKSGLLDNSFDANGVKVVNAVFDEFIFNPETSFVDKELKDLSAVEIYALSKIGIKNTKMVLEDGDPYSITFGYDVNYDNETGTGEIPSKVIVAEKTSFNGTSDYIDTGIKLFEQDRDFTLALDYEFLSGTKANSVIAQCFQANGSIGFKLSYNNGVQLNWCGKTSKNIPGIIDYRDMLVIRHKAGSSTLDIYMSNLNESTTINVESLDGDKNTMIDSTLVLGCAKPSEGDYESNALGNIHWCKVWYRDLGDSVCRKLANWTHEKVSFEMCGLNRFYLTKDPSKRSTFSLLATHLLERDRAWNVAKTNVGGWSASDLNKFLNDRLYNSLSGQAKYILKEVTVDSLNGSNSTDTTSSNCYITIPAAVELSTSYDKDPYNKEIVAIDSGKTISFMSPDPLSAVTVEDRRKRAYDGGEFGKYHTRTTNPENGTSRYIYNIDVNGYINGYDYPEYKRGILIEISF